MNKKAQQFLLELARRSLEHFFNTDQVLEVFENELPDEALKEKRGVFVTLTKGGQLRGCIGHIEPNQKVYLDVVENALLAAFDDLRFDPLLEEELDKVVIEISILTVPQELKYSSVDDLLGKLIPLKHGVIIQKGKFSATYLPQVWEDIEDQESFLSSLCIKAGLEAEEWRKEKLEVQVYEAEVFTESAQ